MGEEIDLDATLRQVETAWRGIMAAREAYKEMREALELIVKAIDERERLGMGINEGEYIRRIAMAQLNKLPATSGAERKDEP